MFGIINKLYNEQVNLILILIFETRLDGSIKMTREISKCYKF